MENVYLSLKETASPIVALFRLPWLFTHADRDGFVIDVFVR